MNKEELTVNEVNSMLNKHSGLLAISGISSDMREITEGMEKAIRTPHWPLKCMSIAFVNTSDLTPS